jgi:hypothetical protein
LLFNVSLHLSQFIMPVARGRLVDCGGHGTSFTRRPTRGRRQRMVNQYVRWTSIRVFRLSRGGARRPKMRSCTTEAEKFQFFSGSWRRSVSARYRRAQWPRSRSQQHACRTVSISVASFAGSNAVIAPRHWRDTSQQESALQCLIHVNASTHLHEKTHAHLLRCRTPSQSERHGKVVLRNRTAQTDS